MDENHLLIGDIAARARVSTATVRYYERRGLLPAPARRASGYRSYSADIVSRIGFIKRAQALGFTLAEIRALLELRSRRGASNLELVALVEPKIVDLEAQLAQLSRIHSRLRELVPEGDPAEVPVDSSQLFQHLENGVEDD